MGTIASQFGFKQDWSVSSPQKWGWKISTTVLKRADFAGLRLQTLGVTLLNKVTPKTSKTVDQHPLVKQAGTCENMSKQIWITRLNSLNSWLCLESKRSINTSQTYTLFWVDLILLTATDRTSSIASSQFIHCCPAASRRSQSEESRCEAKAKGPAS